MYDVSVEQYLCFFFNDTATTEIYTLSLHDALPISRRVARRQEEVDLDPVTDAAGLRALQAAVETVRVDEGVDRKSTRLNSSHANISYAVFCLKKKSSNSPARISRRCSSCRRRARPG